MIPISVGKISNNRRVMYLAMGVDYAMATTVWQIIRNDSADQMCVFTHFIARRLATMAVPCSTPQ